MSECVQVTEKARELIARLKARYGSLMFVQSGGCCDGSSPVCLREGELLLGEIEGCPFYIDREQYERWQKPRLLIDVSQGEGDTFSIEGPEGLHFVAHTMSKSDPESFTASA